MKIKLGVIFGGETTEHEVSIISAVQAMASLNNEKYEIYPIYMGKDKTWYTGKMLMDIEIYKDMPNLKRYATKVGLIRRNGIVYIQRMNLLKTLVTDLDIVFPIVHGNNVEDGSIQGFLQTLGIPFVGSSILGSAIGQDKVIIKQLLESENIPVTPYVWFYEEEYLMDKDLYLKKIKKLGYPVIVKPANLGSSIGIAIANSDDNIEKALSEAMQYDCKILVEKVVPNLTELNCSVLGDYTHSETSAIEEVMGKDEYLSYKDKYLGGKKGNKTSKGMLSTDRVIPAKIDEKVEDRVRELAMKTFYTLNLSGVARIDFLYDKKNNHLFVNEPNTIPGSLSFYLWEPVGKKYEELLDNMINIAIKNYKRKTKKIVSFESNILNNFNGLKGSKGKLKSSN